MVEKRMSSTMKMGISFIVTLTHFLLYCFNVHSQNDYERLIRFYRYDGDYRCAFKFLNVWKYEKGYNYANEYELYEVCCPFNKTYIDFSLNIIPYKDNCCIYETDDPDRKHNAIQAGRKYNLHMGGPRLCSGLGIWDEFREWGSAWIKKKNESTYERYICSKSTFLDFDSTSWLIDGRVFYKDHTHNCSDPSKPHHIKVGYMGYSWCCGVDISDNYLVNPRFVCCGLAGSQSQRYSELSGELGWIGHGTPPCCRLQNEMQPCEPLVFASGISNPSSLNSHVCPPLSGMANITKDLGAEIPNYAPTYYAFKDKMEDLRSDPYTISYCLDVGPNYQYF